MIGKVKPAIHKKPTAFVHVIIRGGRTIFDLLGEVSCIESDIRNYSVPADRISCMEYGNDLLGSLEINDEYFCSRKV